MLVEKLEQLSQLKRQLQKEQKIMDEIESQRMSPNSPASFFHKKRLPLSNEIDVSEVFSTPFIRCTPYAARSW
jgi:hypothetical protein